MARRRKIRYSSRVARFRAKLRRFRETRSPVFYLLLSLSSFAALGLALVLVVPLIADQIFAVAEITRLGSLQLQRWYFTLQVINLVFLGIGVKMAQAVLHFHHRHDRDSFEQKQQQVEKQVALLDSAQHGWQVERQRSAAYIANLEEDVQRLTAERDARDVIIEVKDSIIAANETQIERFLDVNADYRHANQELYSHVCRLSIQVGDPEL